MFKAPSTVPQDLLLIRDLVSEPGPSSIKTQHGRGSQTSSDSIDSTSSESESSVSETDSEEVDVVENLLAKEDGTDEGGDKKMHEPSVSSSESVSDDSASSSDSDCDEEELVKATEKQVLEDFDEDEDEGGGAFGASSGSVLRTKNEMPDDSVVTPDITEIDTQEPLEKVGEIMSIIENTVVVKGIPSENENKASLRALDSESLLVFGDRKVLGYVYETFGPTHQPLYQVKFPSAASIDRSVVNVSREVFHVPPRSHFVFPIQLAKMKGSDASNVYDEEVNDDEVEFSDDEAEAAFRQRRKRKRDGHRESSVASSRFSTPVPCQMRDQELNDGSFYGTSPYDEYGPYDVGVAPGPSRPAPLPYDDPYQDDYSSAPLHNTSTQSTENRRDLVNKTYSDSRGRGRIHGRGRGRGRGRERGRGGELAGRGRFGNDASRRPSGGGSLGERRPSFDGGSNSNSYSTRSISPTSMAIAQVTGQLPGDGSITARPSPLTPSSLPSTPQGYWQQQTVGYTQYDDPSQHASYGVQQMFPGQHPGQTYAQPHINPRFASLFGLNMNHMQGQQYSPYGASNSSAPSSSVPYPPSTAWTNNVWSQQNTSGGPDSVPVDKASNEYASQVKYENGGYVP